jgi:hypothetical protein
MAVFDTMRHIRPDVSSVCIGMAASMGAFLLASGHQVGALGWGWGWAGWMLAASWRVLWLQSALAAAAGRRQASARPARRALGRAQCRGCRSGTHPCAAPAPHPQGKRYSLPNSRIMIHQPLGGAQGQATDIEIQANEILHHKLTLNGYLVGGGEGVAGVWLWSVAPPQNRCCSAGPCHSAHAAPASLRPGPWPPPAAASCAPSAGR